MTILTWKQVWSAYHLKYFQNNQILKSRDYTNPPYLPTLKTYPTPILLDHCLKVYTTL